MNPMLAQVWSGQPQPGAWIVEPKIDGVRAIIAISQTGLVEPLSRNAKPLFNLENVVSDLKVRNLTNVILDGEVYDGRSFDTTSAIVRTQYPHRDRDKLVYHVFDVMVPGISPSLLVRKEYLKRALSAISKSVQVLPSIAVKQGVDWNFYTRIFHKHGYEGAMFKHLGGQYEEGKRSAAWLKAKPVYEGDLRIIGMNPGEGKYADTLGALAVAGKVFYLGVEREVSCTLSGMDDSMRHWFWRMKDNPNVVGIMEVQVEFQSVTEDGSLRFPRFVRTREDKL